MYASGGGLLINVPQLLQTGNNSFTRFLFLSSLLYEADSC